MNPHLAWRRPQDTMTWADDVHTVDCTSPTLHSRPLLWVLLQYRN